MKEQEKKELFADFEAMLDSIAEVATRIPVSDEVERASSFDKQQFTTALAAKPTLRETIQHCVDTIVSIGGEYAQAVYLLDPERGGLHLAYSRYLSRTVEQSIQEYASDSIVVRRVAGGKPTYRNLVGIGLLDDFTGNEDAPSIIAILPIHHNYKVIGSIHLLSASHSEIPGYARFPLQTIAVQCGGAIARFLKGDIRVISSRVREERARLEPEQHLPVSPPVPESLNGHTTSAAATLPKKMPSGKTDAPLPARSPGVRTLSSAPQRTQQPATGAPPRAAQKQTVPTSSGAAQMIARAPNATELLINSIPAFTFVMTMDGRIAYINKYTLDRLGYPKQEIIGSFITSLYPSGKQYTNLDRKYAILEHQEGDITYLLQAKSGTVYGVHFSVHRSRFNKKEAMVCIGNEEHAHYRGDDKPLGEKIESLSKELASLKSEMEELKSYSENEEKKQAAFIEKVSYEIRSMLNAVIGMTGLLLDTELDDEQQEYVDTIRKSGDGMLEHINDIIESLNFMPDTQPNDSFYNRFLGDEMSGELSGVDFAGKRLLFIDEDRGNRTTIARELESAGWKVTAVATVAEAEELLSKNIPLDAVILDIDISRGNPVALAHDIRKKYPEDALFIILTSKSEPEDGSLSGLGAAIFVQKPYEVDLVRYRLAKFLAAQQAKQLSRVTTTENGEKALQILLVEDNHMDQKIAQWMLHNMGYEATIAENGIEALRIAEEKPFDLILMDIEMPEMNGVETTKKIRERLPSGKQPKIIAMTAHALKGDREQYLGAGMDDYISKPVNERKLAEVFRRYFSGDSGESGTQGTATL